MNMNIYENNPVELQEITPGDPYPVYDPPAEPMPEPNPAPLPNPEPFPTPAEPNSPTGPTFPVPPEPIPAFPPDVTF
jgi:hypothetical protein